MSQTPPLLLIPDRPAEPPQFEIVDAEERDGVLLRDIRFGIEGDDPPVEAWLVEPTVLDARQGRPGLLFAHWFDTDAPNGNRTEFLDEAAGWARRHRAAAILPQLTFPWHQDPTGSAIDRARIVAEVSRLRRCLDLVAARPAVDPARLAVVGHDFGAMHAVILASADGRPAAYALLAATPRWGDWFLPFWSIDEDRNDYLAAIRPADPIEHLAAVAPAALLLQHARRDFYVALMSGLEMRRAAGEAELKAYDAEHDMADPEALADRTAFLERVLAVSG